MATAMLALGTGLAAAQTSGAQTPGMTGRPPAANSPAANTARPANPPAVTGAQPAAAAQPAKGANSFTMGEARSRIERSGFQSVADLKKDRDGIWRGRAQKNGTQVDVWLDYKGNVGSSQM
jgi:hypothetical protein